MIGAVYDDCNDTNAVLYVGIGVRDCSLSPDIVTQPWSNYVTYVSEEDRWEKNEELTLICEGEHT